MKNSFKLSGFLGHPDDRYGYTRDYLEEQLEQFGPDCFNNFKTWMAGQTVMLNDDGKTVYYSYDIYRFLDKGGINAEVLD